MKKREKKPSRLSAYRRAVKMELREYKSSFIVFLVLGALVLVALVRMIMLGRYESAFYCVLAAFLLYVPSIVQVRLRIDLPPALEISILCFIFAAEILGEVAEFYLNVQGWDTMLHTINGFLAAAVGFSLVAILNNSKKLMFKMSPLFMALTAFCFSMTIGVLWEFFEFGADLIFHTDMQKDTILNAIYSVDLNPEGINHAVGITDISSVAVNGEELGLGGYLDIGLFDTMKDLLVNFVGAVVFSVFGYIYVKSKGKSAIVSAVVPIPKDADTDYLAQAQAEQENSKREMSATKD